MSSFDLLRPKILAPNAFYNINPTILQAVTEEQNILSLSRDQRVISGQTAYYYIDEQQSHLFGAKCCLQTQRELFLEIGAAWSVV